LNNKESKRVQSDGIQVQIKVRYAQASCQQKKVHVQCILPHALEISFSPSGDTAGQQTIEMRLYGRGNRHKRPFAQRAITRCGTDGSNSLWRFINSKAPLHAASCDVSGKVA